MLSAQHVTTRILGGVLGGASLIAFAACSLVVDTTDTQCTTNSDCTAKGAGFAGTVCGSQGVCVSTGDSGGPDGATPDTASSDMLSPDTTAQPDPVAEISAGHFHTCARLVSGQVKCWGDNGEGQLGDGKDPAVEPKAPLPVVVADALLKAPFENVKEISCGEADNCAVTDDGTLWCWGANDEGQLGIGTADSVLGAKQVVGISKDTAAHPGGGDAFNCVVLKSGAVNCFGLNDVGQLGDGKDPATEPGTKLPVKVSGITTAVSVSLGESHACVVTDNKTVVCWGNNDSGQLGNGDATTVTSSNVPLPVPGLSNVIEVEAGEKHTCAVLSNPQAIYCWGKNDMGQLGDNGASGQQSATPVKVAWPDSTVPKGVSAGGDHTCARNEGGGVYCWGSNGGGESGQDPSKVSKSLKPLAVSGVTNAGVVTVGNEHSCALLGTTPPTVVCWGSNAAGQLGDNEKEGTSHKPIEVQGL